MEIIPEEIREEIKAAIILQTGGKSYHQPDVENLFRLFRRNQNGYALLGLESAITAAVRIVVEKKAVRPEKLAKLLHSNSLTSEELGLDADEFELLSEMILRDFSPTVAATSAPAASMAITAVPDPNVDAGAGAVASSSTSSSSTSMRVEIGVESVVPNRSSDRVNGGGKLSSNSSISHSSKQLPIAVNDSEEEGRKQRQQQQPPIIDDLSQQGTVGALPKADMPPPPPPAATVANQRQQQQQQALDAVNRQQLQRETSKKTGAPPNIDMPQQRPYHHGPPLGMNTPSGHAFNNSSYFDNQGAVGVPPSLQPASSLSSTPSSTSKSSDDDCISFTVNVASTGTVLKLQTTPQSTITQLRQHVGLLLKLEHHRVCLAYKKNHLPLQNTVDQCGIVNGSEVHCDIHPEKGRSSTPSAVSGRTSAAFVQRATATPPNSSHLDQSTRNDNINGSTVHATAPPSNTQSKQAQPVKNGKPSSAVIKAFNADRIKAVLSVGQEAPTPALLESTAVPVVSDTSHSAVQGQGNERGTLASTSNDKRTTGMAKENKISGQNFDGRLVQPLANRYHPSPQPLVPASTAAPLTTGAVVSVIRPVSLPGKKNAPPSWRIILVLP